jgi:hypothetical protein
MYCSSHRIKKKSCVPLFEETTRITNVRRRGSKKYLDITAVKKNVGKSKATYMKIQHLFPAP